MFMIMKNKKILIIIILLLSIIFPNNSFAFPTKNTASSDLGEFTFKQEINIPIDTAIDQAKYHPIDIKIKFENPCYAVDSESHSVRVGVENQDGVTEIESQIYDLEKKDETHIKSCSIVFLVPEFADGKEEYYFFYDSSKKETSNYEDHIEIEDTHYFYEPISGQKIDFDYYKITEDGFVVYAVMQKGELLGNPIGQGVGKLKPNTEVVETNRIDQLSGFDFRYGIKEQPGYYGTSWANEVKKTVLIDGNLMARMRIECVSPNNEAKTDNIYTYYYQPREDKKICVNCHHEVLKDIKIEDPELYDGTYAGIISIKSRSATIEKMNVGDILPELYVYSEQKKVERYNVPQNPESEIKEAVLSTNADIDLGEKAWVSLYDPKEDKSHAMIIESNKGITNSDEDGVQVKAWVKQNVKLPGLEADTGSVFLLRNAYEKDTGHNTKISKGFTADYNIEFLTFYKEGQQKIDAESSIFQKLIKDVPIGREGVIEEREKTGRYSLETYVHFAPSCPIGALLSAAFGKDLSYIYAELYEENTLISSGNVGRLSLASMELDLEGKNIIEKIRTIIGMFDWKNASFFKKIVFPGLEKGTYVVKIFKENPLFNEDRKFIGFDIVEINKNTTNRIFCRPQANLKISIKDQNKDPVENVKFVLLQKNATIVDILTDKNGTVDIFAPCFPLKPYTLKAIYQGFLLSEKQIKLGLINRLLVVKESFLIERYNLDVNVKDAWGFKPEIDVKPTLSSDEMIEQIFISPEKRDYGKYIFEDIYKSDYDLSLSYKSYELKEKLTVNEDKKIDLIFPAEYEVILNVFDFFGQKIKKAKINLERNGRKEILEIKPGDKNYFQVPPGEYKLSVYSEGKEIAKQKINVLGEKNIDIVSKKDSLFHNAFFFFGLIFCLFSLLIIFWKKKIYSGVKLFVIGLLIIALISPWWVLSGECEGISTNTKVQLIPPKIVSLTESSSVIGGDIGLVPEEVTMVLSLLSLLIALTCILMFVSIFSKDKFRKITLLLSTISFIVLLMVMALFLYTMLQVTEIGVGSFMGNGNIDTTIPGTGEAVGIPSSWGPGLGFILGTIVLFVLVIFSLLRKFKPDFIKNHS